MGAKGELGSLRKESYGWRREDLFFPFKDRGVLRLLEKENVQYGRVFQNDHLIYSNLFLFPFIAE